MQSQVVKRLQQLISDRQLAINCD